MSAAHLHPQQVLAQLEKICANKLFARAGELQGFLRYLVKRRLDGDDNTDSYSGKLLAYEFFGRDTAIAKVQGNKLRKRLRKYYETDGLSEPILIEIPPGPFRPEILANPYLFPPLSEAALELVWVSNAMSGKLETAIQSEQLLDKALAIHPGHPRLLGLKAMLYAEAGFYEEFADARFILGEADSLVREARMSGPMSWEMLYAEGAVETLLHWNWKAADDAFRRALALNSLGTSRTAMYAYFLACQQRFDDILSLVVREIDLGIETGREPTPAYFDMLAFFRLISRDSRFDRSEFRRAQRAFPALTPTTALALAAEADDDPETAINIIERDIAADSTKESRALLAVLALCAGLLGLREKAQRAYDQIVVMDARVEPGKNCGPYTGSFNLAVAAIGLGRSDLAVEWLNKAAGVDHRPNSLLINIYPPLRHISHHPGYLSLVCGRMKLQLGPALTVAGKNSLLGELS